MRAPNLVVVTGAESAVACLWRDLQPPLLRYPRTFDRAAAEDLASDEALFRNA